MLVALDSEALEGSLVDSAAPTVFRIAGSDGFTGLLMPVRS
jgi:DNA polymerase III sliding clamp (beta) subunit (PCNA family)